MAVLPVNVHLRVGFFLHKHASLRGAGVTLVVITDGAQGGEQRSNAPENSRVAMETWDTE